VAADDVSGRASRAMRASGALANHPSIPASARSASAPYRSRFFSFRFSCGGKHAHVMFDGWKLG